MSMRMIILHTRYCMSKTMSRPKVCIHMSRTIVIGMSMTYSLTTITAWAQAWEWAWMQECTCMSITMQVHEWQNKHTLHECECDIGNCHMKMRLGLGMRMRMKVRVRMKACNYYIHPWVECNQTPWKGTYENNIVHWQVRNKRCTLTILKLTVYFQSIVIVTIQIKVGL